MKKTEIAALLYDKVKHLTETTWRERGQTLTQIEAWVSQFQAAPNLLDDEQMHALYLLSNFTYFGQVEIRALMVSLFRDLFRTPVVHSIRRKHGGTSDVGFLNSTFEDELGKTRFLGVGNPSESGSHLLYYFRQENDLHKSSFIHSHQVFARSAAGNASPIRLRDEAIKHYVFIDDLCGSGTQAEEYSRDIVDPIKSLKPDAEVHYLVLFATVQGLAAVRGLSRYDHVAAVFELDESFKSLDPASRIFSGKDGRFDRMKVRATCEKYGSQLWAPHPLGYKDGQLLMGFNHNTPDNTLPLFWRDAEYPIHWEAMFRRYHKK